VDVEAVRVCEEGIPGHRAVLCEAWERYRIPVALTEVHLACSREQQVRWLVDAWNGAHEAKAAGCDVRAITAWALMGSFGWDKLLTEVPFSYESGAFDLRDGHPRATAVSAVIRDLATRAETNHPAAIATPWWATATRATPLATFVEPGRAARRRREILILGGSGTLGTAFRKVCDGRGLPYRAPRRAELDVSDEQMIAAALESICPELVINAAGYVRVDDAEADAASCYAANATAASIVARQAARRGIPFLTFSSDLVFDGRKRTPYVESDCTAPLNVYGASKVRAEKEVLSVHDDALVIRTGAFFGPWDDFNFATRSLRQMADGTPVVVPSNGVVSPTYVPDLANASLDLLLDGDRGVWHLANEGAVSWHEFAAMLARRAGFADDFLLPQTIDSGNTAASYPAYSVLTSERGAVMPSLYDGIDRYFRELTIPINSPISA
jgi:dTDP-4-dehydrorhamnose reductase